MLSLVLIIYFVIMISVNPFGGSLWVCYKFCVRAPYCSVRYFELNKILILGNEKFDFLESVWFCKWRAYVLVKYFHITIFMRKGILTFPRLICQMSMSLKLSIFGLQPIGREEVDLARGCHKHNLVDLLPSKDNIILDK